VRAIARELARSPSVISAELGRGRKARLVPDGPLFAEVTRLLRLQWSPEQIAGRRKRLEDGADMSSGLPVSHEAIYQAIYASVLHGGGRGKGGPIPRC
jgi:IS30 family transposase